MENKLCVGMYVRTKHYGISKIKSILSNSSIELDRLNCFGTNGVIESISNIIGEPSFNIIDLIKAGDYIRIITSASFDFVYESYGKLVIRDDIDISKYTNKFIAEVITREQMEEISYKVGV